MKTLLISIFIFTDVFAAINYVTIKSKIVKTKSDYSYVRYNNKTFKVVNSDFVGNPNLIVGNTYDTKVSLNKFKKIME